MHCRNSAPARASKVAAVHRRDDGSRRSRVRPSNDASGRGWGGGGGGRSVRRRRRLVDPDGPAARARRRHRTVWRVVRIDPRLHRRRPIGAAVDARANPVGRALERHDVGRSSGRRSRPTPAGRVRSVPCRAPRAERAWRSASTSTTKPGWHRLPSAGMARPGRSSRLPPGSTPASSTACRARRAPRAPLWVAAQMHSPRGGTVSAGRLTRATSGAHRSYSVCHACRRERARRSARTTSACARTDTATTSSRYSGSGGLAAGRCGSVRISGAPTAATVVAGTA